MVNSGPASQAVKVSMSYVIIQRVKMIIKIILHYKIGEKLGKGGWFSVSHIFNLESGRRGGRNGVRLW